MYDLHGVDVSNFYIAKESYNNTRQCVYGFLHHVEILFKEQTHVYIVYTVHMN